MNWLRKLFGMHVHVYSDWKTLKVLSSKYGEMILIQTRICEKCNYAQIDKQRV